VVNHETSYDQHHKNADRVYRVETENIQEQYAHAGTYTEMGAILRSEVAEIETVVPIWHEWGQSFSIPAEGKFFKEPVAFADNGLFNVLDYEWVRGEARTALSEPNQVVLTESYAEKFFGTTDIIGKTIRYGANQDLSVTGVLKDLPGNDQFSV
jgi:putative ABC transport system permease protein